MVTVEFKPGKNTTEAVLTHEHLPETAVKGHTGGWTDILKELAEKFRAARAA